MSSAKESRLGREAGNVGGINARQSDPIAKYEHCSYCGSPLNYTFYFCTVCATPYRPISEVIPPIPPRPLTEGELIRQKVPNVWRVFWTYAVVIFVVVLLNHALYEGQQKANALIFGTVCLLLTTVVFEVIFWRSLVVQLKRFRFLTAEVLVGFLILAGLLVVNYGYRWFIVYFLGAEDASDMWLHGSGLSSAAIFVLICLIPGITEEIAFRGLIQHWLQTALKPWRAILLASALFTALHLSVLSAPYIFLLGLLLGWVKYKSGSLYPSMVMHIVHNWVVVSVFPMVMQ